MSKLDRMNLMGIRSFGPDEKDVQKIKFISPLTLFQGQNGCGKTTIIETIKFAITGELPGGSARGQGFVYDPKLAKSFETVGKVKLRIVDGKGDLVTVFKIVRVLQKGPDKLEFKRVDSTISRGRGNPMHASNRCADVDQEMCLALGVSKPIINQVLFCHQEDSNWPLDESKKLKERFDEIFDAAKYNKCMDHVTKKIKERSDKLKLMNIEVDGFLATKRYVESKKLTLHDKKEMFNGLTENVAEIDLKIKPINDRINALYTIEQNFSRLYTNIELKKKELEHLKQQQKDILKNVKEFEGSDDELNNKVNKFESDLRSYEEDIVALKKKSDECVSEERKLALKINQVQNTLGILQAEANHNEKNIDDRDKLLLNAANELDVKTTSVNEANVKSLMNEVKRCFEANVEKLKTEESRMENEEEQVQIEIDLAREQNAQLAQKIKSKRKQLEELENEMRTIKQKLKELNMADDQLKLSENKLQRAENDIKSLESSLDTVQLRKQIDEEKVKLKALQDRSEIVENEVRELQQYTNIQTELDVKNENLLSKKKDVEKLMFGHQLNLMYIFLDKTPKTELKSELDAAMQSKRKIKKQTTHQIEEKQKVVLKLENNLSTNRDKLKEKENELISNIQKIRDVCEGEPLDTLIEDTNNRLKRFNDHRGSLTFSTFLYTKFINKFKEDKPCCPLCKRDVQEKSAVQEIIDDIKKQIENIPNELKEIEERLGLEQKRHEKLLSLKPLNDRKKQLKETEIPALKSQIEGEQKEYEKYKGELNSLKSEQTVSEKYLEIADKVYGDVCLVDQSVKEMAMLEEQIAALEKRLPSSFGTYDSDKRSIDEAMSERENLNLDIRSAQANIESRQRKLNQHTERLNMRREEKNALLAQQLTIKKNLQDKDHLVTKSIEIEDKLISGSVNVTELEEQTEPAKETLNAFIKRKAELRAKHQKTLNEMRMKISNEQKKITQITSLQKGIDEFKNKNIIEQMEVALKEKATHKQDIDAYTCKKNKLEATIDELKRKVSNGQMYFRELQDNVQLREKRKQAEKLSKNIEVEEKNLGQNDIIQIRSEKDKLIDECDRLTEQKHRKEGEKRQLKEVIAELKKELAEPKNVTAAEDFRRKHTELLLMKCVVIDMKEFIKAMDWSLMQYHKKRMVQVNSIIKELWRTIYKGNDIDYIEIKTDDIKTKGLEKRKVYSYRVVQVKNDVELDMRGRCSAGQRVLASLIIRIALAETFSNNCGILALDEPTTNLDRENINSLADALIELIQQKQQQKHFQLLIITHDQEFVDRLTQMESLDQYYEIKRNEVGKSVINVRNRY